MRVAAVSLDSKPGETTRNIEKIGEWCARAAAEAAELVLFPELSLTGFIPNHPVGDHAAWLREALVAARRFAEPIPGPAVNVLIDVARAHNIYICAGMLEDAGNLMHNTQVLVGPEGLCGVWRKLHIPMFEMPFYNGGSTAPVVETPLGRIGVNICFDVLLPESTRLLAVQNVEIVLFPFAADPVEGWSTWAGPAIRARCAENGIFGVACNYAGEVHCAGVSQTFPGGAMAGDPRGTIIAEWNGSPMLIVNLERETLLAARSEPEYLFRFRRPELYGPLAE